MDHAWKRQAACKDHPKHWWIPHLDANDRPRQPHPWADRYCAACPVAANCLTAELEFAETYGRFARTGPNERRHLRALHQTAGHGYRPDCDCTFCAKVTAICDALYGQEPRVDSNGAGARCGHVATYGRGHRDTACMHASSNADHDYRARDEPTPTEAVIVQASRRRCPHSQARCTACKHSAARPAKAAA